MWHCYFKTRKKENSTEAAAVSCVFSAPECLWFCSSFLRLLYFCPRSIASKLSLKIWEMCQKAGLCFCVNLCPFENWALRVAPSGTRIRAAPGSCVYIIVIANIGAKLLFLQRRQQIERKWDSNFDCIATIFCCSWQNHSGCRQTKMLVPYHSYHCGRGLLCCRSERHDENDVQRLGGTNQGHGHLGLPVLSNLRTNFLFFLAAAAYCFAYCRHFSKTR